MTRVAAIDCGTNSIRLLIADIEQSNGSTTLRDVVREMRVVRLGQGVDATGELAPEGILVNAVAPGVIETAMTEGHLGNDYYRRAVLEPTPLRRAGTPEEVAAVIAFLASADAAYVAGQVIAVDGGWLAARHPPREAG